MSGSNAFDPRLAARVSLAAATVAVLPPPGHDGEVLVLLGYAAPGDGGGGLFRWQADSAAAPDGGTVFASAYCAQGRWHRLYEGALSVRWFGARGDGHSDDTAAVRAAIRAAGEGGELYFPASAGGYRVSSLQMLRGQSWTGPGREHATLLGDGSDVLVKTNPYPADHYPVRNVRLRGLHLVNKNHAALQLHGCPDSSVQECTLQSSGAGAYSQILSARCAINRNRLLSSGTGVTAACFLDNCNGTDASNNTISGGTAGNAVVVGQTQTLNLDNTVIEVGGGVGVSIGGNVPYGGACSGISLRGLYLEQVRRPLEIGLHYAVFGVDLSGLYISNRMTSVVAARDAAIHLGRVHGLVMEGFYPTGSGSEALFELYDVTDGAGPFPFLEASRLCSSRVSGYRAHFVKNAAFVAERESRIFGRNLIQLNGATATGAEREWLSPVLSAVVAWPPTLVVEPTPGGGLITAVDLLECNGRPACTLQLGSETAMDEALSLDTATLSFTHGFCRVLTEAAPRHIRPRQGLLLRLLPGSGTGTFRLRIRYRV